MLILVSPLIYSVWIVLAAKLSGERREMVGQANDSGAAAATATALMMTATAGVYWGWALFGGRPVLPAEIPSAAWGGLIGVGVVSTFIAIQTFYAGTRRIGAAQAALISTVEPFYTIVLAALLFGIALTPVQLLGGVLIIVAWSSPRPGRAPPGGRCPRSASPTSDGQPRPAAASMARTPDATNEPSEPRPMKRNPSSTCRAITAVS